MTEAGLQNADNPAYIKLSPLWNSGKIAKFSGVAMILRENCNITT